MAVGPTFDQRTPNAMMMCRMGYCHAFESLGIPYVIADVNEVDRLAKDLHLPFIMYFANDLLSMSSRKVKELKKYPSAVWVPPWFENSDKFFAQYGLDPNIWTLPDPTVRKILQLEPAFCFTATTLGGLSYFVKWEQNGIPVRSYPLACDTTLYNENSANQIDFKNVRLAFVGGYWQSKGMQIDEYLRPFEEHLDVYGYSKWPYSGYKGLLSIEAEPSLYRQARVCPVINEPTVALLKGQINERVFKVLGSGGCPVVDAVPAYRELYSEDELLLSESPEHFSELVNMLLDNPDMNNEYRKKGNAATLSRHTYIHRAQSFLQDLGISLPA